MQAMRPEYITLYVNFITNINYTAFRGLYGLSNCEHSTLCLSVNKFVIVSCVTVRALGTRGRLVVLSGQPVNYEAILMWPFVTA